ncbi:MAG: hypothetical protein AAGJ37_04955 [Pseudomonadota bacterium]
MNLRHFKFQTGIILLALSTISHADITTALNTNIEKCFAATLKSAGSASTRPCNNVIKSRISNRDNTAIAYHNCGIIQMRAGELEQALTSFERAMRFHPEQIVNKQSDSAMTLLAIANVYQVKNKLDIASAKVDKVLAMDANNQLAIKMKTALDQQKMVDELSNQKSATLSGILNPFAHRQHD